MDRADIRRWLADVGAGPRPELRQQVLANVRAVGRRRDPLSRPARGPDRRLGLPQILAAAAALALFAFVAGALSGALLGPRPAEPDRLAQAAMMMAELARDPAARTMRLRDAGGADAGTVIFEPASRRLVVFSGALPPAPEGYDCFVERDAERTWIGPMHEQAGAHFWGGPVGRAPADLGRPGDRFIVLRDAADPDPMLEADF